MSIVAKRLAKATQTKQVATSVQEPVKSPKKNPAPEIDNTKKELELFNASVESDRAQLKTFSTIEDKNEYKAEAIEKNDYLGFINRFLASGANYPNFTFTWVFIWLVDLGRWSQALKFLPHLISQQQHLPTQFNTKEWTTFVIDQLYDAGAAVLQAQETEPNAVERSGLIKVFNQLIDFVEQEKPLVNAVVLGKLYAIAAKLEVKLCNYGNALNHCVAATQANDSAGVKTLGKELAKKIDKDFSV